MQWAWIDTCCIDKRSSAELSEAINSMYAWYRRSAECVVYLADVSFDPSSDDPAALEAALQQSVWFTRGWTLQELLAPKMKVFCNANWQVLCHVCDDASCHIPSKSSHDRLRYGFKVPGIISKITGIDESCIIDNNVQFHKRVAKRMSWASWRTTTRPEDAAYCLQRIFSVNMTLLYGEGNNAFRRLQEEIIRTSTDESVFAWLKDDQPVLSGGGGLVASEISLFEGSDKAEAVREVPRSSDPCSMTNIGVQMSVQVFDLPKSTDQRLCQRLGLRKPMLESMQITSAW